MGCLSPSLARPVTLIVVHRFYLAPDQCVGDLLRLTGSEAHHAAVVLRVRVGDRAMVLDGLGTELIGHFVEVGRRESVVAVDERRRHPERPFSVHLAVALLKGRAWDSILEKATELGAAGIQPLAAERSVVQIARDDVAAKLVGWRATTISAAKQCGTPWLPPLLEPQTPTAWMSRRTPGSPATELLLVASLEAGTRSILGLLAGTRESLGRRPERVTVVIGPEGDFTPGEYQVFREGGAQAISLGSLVLRADTAVIAALAVVQAGLE